MATLSLHGFPVSNYVNIVKWSLLSKELEFEDIKQIPDGSEALLAQSTMGKIPFLTTEQGCLSETSVILEYLEELQPTPVVAQLSAFERAKTREWIQHMTGYVELVARRLYPGVYFGGSNDEATIEDVKPLLEKGFRSVKSLYQQRPWQAEGDFWLGAELSYVDVFAYFGLRPAVGIAKQVYELGILADSDGLQCLMQKVSEQPIVQELDQQQAEFIAKMLAK